VGSLVFPPILPMLKPWLPEQYTPLTVMLFPLVIATQSSWFITVEFRSTMFSEVPMPKPSELCDAAFLLDRLFGASPAELSSVIFCSTSPALLLMLKQWTG